MWRKHGCSSGRDPGGHPASAPRIGPSQEGSPIAVPCPAVSRHGAELLHEKVSTVKPMDEAALLKSARKTGRVLTAEEHTVLGGAVAEVLGSLTPARLDHVGLRDCFAECGLYVKLLAR